MGGRFQHDGEILRTGLTRMCLGRHFRFTSPYRRAARKRAAYSRVRRISSSITSPADTIRVETGRGAEESQSRGRYQPTQCFKPIALVVRIGVLLLQLFVFNIQLAEREGFEPSKGYQPLLP